MNTQTAVFVSENWNDYARCYDRLMGLTPYRGTLEKVSASISVTPGIHILDASCGTGNFEYVLSRMYPGSIPTVAGVDASPEMLSRAKVKCQDISSFSFEPADIDNALPFPDEHFDAVTTINTIYAVQNPEKTLLEFYRVLKPGGSIHVVTPKAGYENGFILKEHCGSTKPDDYWKNLHESRERERILIEEAVLDPDVVSDLCLVAEYNARIAVNAVFHFFTESEIRSILMKAGFTIHHLSYTSAAQDFFIIGKKE